jgi:hypothetical protein
VPTRLPDKPAALRRDLAPAARITDVAVALGSLLVVVWALLALDVDSGIGASGAQMRHGEYSPFEISRTARR